MTLPIPAIALRQHTAVLGKTRVGKTSTVKLIIENAVEAGERVCILDTEKSDYWGLTSSASGKRGALPFRILGGPRGHVPLRADSGRIVGELVAQGKLPLSIIDMANFDMGDHQHFFTDFAKTLHKHTRGVLRLVIEEAHNIAPKERIGVGHESLAVYWAKKLATGGGMKGIRLVVVTQRTQALHNALLGSCDTMIAHRTILEADQKPIREWLNNVTRDKDIREEVSDSLGSLAVGEAWVCSGEASSFERVKFPRIKTYDNTASPDSDAEAQDVATAPIDRDELHAILGQAAEEAEAADPKQIPKLKAEISRLTAQLANVPEPQPFDPDTLVAEYERGRTDALTAMREQYSVAVGRVSDALWLALEDVKRRWNPRSVKSSKVMRRLRCPLRQSGDMTRPQYVPMKPGEWMNGGPRRSPPTKSGNLPGPEQRILDSIAWWHGIGKHSPTNAQVAWLAGYSPNGGAYKNPRGALKTKELVAYPEADCLSLTPAGNQVATPIELLTPLSTFVLSKIGGPERRILAAVIAAYPKAMSNAEAAAKAGYSADGGAYKNPRGALRTKSLIDYPQADHLRAADWLFAR